VEAAAEQRPYLGDRTVSTHDSTVVPGALRDVYERLSTTDVDGVRICLPPDRIAVKYRSPGPGLAARLEHWHLAETTDGVLVSTRRITVAAPEPAGLRLAAR
jgi:hypothetical protein